MLLLGLGNSSKRNVPIIEILGGMDIKFIEANKLKQSSRGIYSLVPQGVQKAERFLPDLCFFFCFSRIATRQLLQRIPNGLARSKRAWPLPVRSNPDQEQAWATRGEIACTHQTMHQPKTR
jgi:hypothetical protein